MMFSDLASRMAKAAKNIDVTSVTMKGGMRAKATAAPLKAPMSTPTNSIAPTATGIPSTESCKRAPFSKSSTFQRGLFSKMMGLADLAMKAAPMTLVSEMTAPCERSMPAMMSTNVCPMATTKRGHMLESRLVRLYGGKRCGARSGRGSRRARCRGTG